ncbi:MULTISPECIES: NADH:ubiquinone reductase (Na(+)-transporting) subunit F [Kordiimonas]|jgi:Na(+)-translocating NADH:ubiquinone oxidoreductase F subunit|uniref:NADH:ubiquinone reductase (Na(+)-transporting) subunit F n=1 Tax=Kordiimonas TaxID=288021 RepID=UPI00257E2BC3|nr:NADH:ubiquinone reductase (Na(+)-transporting) subunit F [Kordiimonas sp. UBA4487]
MNLMRVTHKWVGLLLGLQLMLWMLSGFMMSWFEHDQVEGHHLRKHVHAEPAGLAALGPFANEREVLVQVSGSDVLKGVTMDLFQGKPIYKVRTETGTRMFDARTAQPVIIDAEKAREIAVADYAGNGTVKNVTPITAPTMETRESVGPGWRVDFDDEENSSFYLSAETGRIWERRQDTWRLFDIFWMLHIMDYENRKDFNNMFVILSGWIVLWLALTGVIMLVENFRRGDFNLVAAVRQRGDARKLLVSDDGSHFEREVISRGRKTLFDALAAEDIHLPSTCGGGGTCGLCRVRMAPAPVATAADLRQIPASEIEAGYRLSCQHQSDSTEKITVASDLLSARDFEAEVVATRFVTPFICELRLRPLSGEAPAFRPGSYMQVTIPPYSRTLASLKNLPQPLKDAWAESHVLHEVGTEETLHRTYSMANAPEEFGADFLLNVRVALPQNGDVAVPVGAGSAYMCSLEVGEKVTLRGPFGDFALKDNAREKVFIGGGAGMAPLRSMIMHALRNQGEKTPMTFWYGARTSADVYYQETFETLERLHPNFNWYVALSEAANTDWQGYTGMIHEVVRREYLEGHKALHECDFYLCGPPKMLEATLAMLKEMGVDDARIDFDDFGI